MKYNNIAYLRAKHGLTQKELANKVKAHVHAIGYAENNHVGVELAASIAEVLGENLFEVLGLDVFRVLPQNEDDKDVLIRLIKEL